jgi:hypothetical protein
MPPLQGDHLCELPELIQRRCLVLGVSHHFDLRLRGDSDNGIELSLRSIAGGAARIREGYGIRTHGQGIKSPLLYR